MAHAEYDFQALVDAYSDSPDILGEILSIFAEETPERLASLKAAAAAKDFATVRKVAHGLANTTGTLKADQALRIAREIETEAREEKSESLEALVRHLESEIETVLSQISAYRGGE